MSVVDTTSPVAKYPHQNGTLIVDAIESSPLAGTGVRTISDGDLNDARLRFDDEGKPTEDRNAAAISSEITRVMRPSITPEQSEITPQQNSSTGETTTSPSPAPLSDAVLEIAEALHASGLNQQPSVMNEVTELQSMVEKLQLLTSQLPLGATNGANTSAIQLGAPSSRELQNTAAPKTVEVPYVFGRMFSYFSRMRSVRSEIRRLRGKISSQGFASKHQKHKLADLESQLVQMELGVGRF